MPKNFPGSIVNKKCDLFVAAAQNGLLDRPRLLRLPPHTRGMGPAKRLYQIRRITYPAARFFTAAYQCVTAASTLRHAGLRARCRPIRVLARHDPKRPRAPPVFGTVGCLVHVDRLLTPDSSKSTVAPSVSACLVGFGTSTAAARAVDVDVRRKTWADFGPKTARGGAFDDHARIPSVGRLPP